MLEQDGRYCLFFYNYKDKLESHRRKEFISPLLQKVCLKNKGTERNYHKLFEYTKALMLPAYLLFAEMSKIF